MSFSDPVQGSEDQPKLEHIRNLAYQLNGDVARAWHLYLHLSLEYLQIPLLVRIIHYRTDKDHHYDPKVESPNRRAEERCIIAFHFPSFANVIDESVEVVEGDEDGGPAVMWKGFAIQPAYIAPIEAVLKTDSQRALSLT